MTLALRMNLIALNLFATRTRKWLMLGVAAAGLYLFMH